MDPTKKLKTESNPDGIQQEKKNEIDDAEKKIYIQFKNAEGEKVDNILQVPLTTKAKELEAMINEILQNDEEKLYTFFYGTHEIKTSIDDFAKKMKNFSTEVTLDITFHPQSLFFVRPITRQSSSLPGHTDSVLSVQFSPDGQNLASGSGDTTVRFWDVNTELPKETGKGGHRNWVLVIQWSPNGKMLASGDMNGDICLWDPETGKQIGLTMKGHNKWITSISWEPLHMNKDCELFASASKDASIRIWSSRSQQCCICFGGHSKSITKVLWGGQGLIYSSSEDTTIKVWKKDGSMEKELKGHAHWVNTICLSTEHALRTGYFDEKGEILENPEDQQKKALEKYTKLKGSKNERLVSGSDDNTLYMWDPVDSRKPIIRLTGHTKPVNHVQFSPDGRYFISASFDKNLKLWDGFNGAYIASFRGHVASVYQIAWSPDNRLFVSGSKDSTMKVWDIKTKKLMFDLPGHADEVYGVDWSPDGLKVCSGGKDKLLKIWKN
ncbi:notchless-like protein (macronuclear) [Tetrahymena thermophila SB210]|uniref:Notchless-like protein n=1 Tax=Tetrahymena thermophila (strain SB210) TaxID=312017 RepID=Q24FU3_TETTS|nr:notchless-like protein [Tetrahymena thermophila SB210]EAS06667.1 notchless-like protein [Tetrahymena thermophila SB210]|eukprot:XP_001026912.1 notchless-like protein [Tetrahymena thermophila SB210]